MGLLPYEVRILDVAEERLASRPLTGTDERRRGGCLEASLTCAERPTDCWARLDRRDRRDRGQGQRRGGVAFPSRFPVVWAVVGVVSIGMFSACAPSTTTSVASGSVPTAPGSEGPADRRVVIPSGTYRFHATKVVDGQQSHSGDGVVSFDTQRASFSFTDSATTAGGWIFVDGITYVEDSQHCGGRFHFGSAGDSPSDGGTGLLPGLWSDPIELVHLAVYLSRSVQPAGANDLDAQITPDMASDRTAPNSVATLLRSNANAPVPVLIRRTTSGTISGGRMTFRQRSAADGRDHDYAYELTWSEGSDQTVVAPPPESTVPANDPCELAQGVSTQGPSSTT